MSDQVAGKQDQTGVSKYRPSAEPFVDDSFPDSEYDADPEFGRSDDDDLYGNDEDDEGNVRDFSSGDSTFGAGLGAGPSAADLAAGDAADRARTAHELRLRLDAATPGRSGNSRKGERRDVGASSFAEGASRLTAKNLGSGRTDDAEPQPIGGLIIGALARDQPGIGNPNARPGRLLRNQYVELVATPKGVHSLRSGGISVVFHIPHEIADQALHLHALQDIPVKIRIYELKEQDDVVG